MIVAISTKEITVKGKPAENFSRVLVEFAAEEAATQDRPTRIFGKMTMKVTLVKVAKLEAARGIRRMLMAVAGVGNTPRQLNA